MSKAIFKLFIDDPKGKRFRKQIRQRDRGDPRVGTGEAMPEGKHPPKWFIDHVEFLKQSPMAGD